MTDSAGSVVYSASYDADGDMTTRNGFPLTWTVDNLPASLASATGSSTFDYGPGGNRYQQVATEGGNSTTTIYIAGGLFEVVATATTMEYRHAIFADGQVIAVHTIDQGGSASTSYLHYDQLGSVDTLTDDQGAVIQKMSFDAFGLRRDAGNWTYDLSSSQIAPLTGLTNRGYTDQEQLDNVALVDLNGRVYDPTVGRFISADPTVPDPLYSQAFNRYSYVNDNPLSLSDPSGYFSTDAVLGVVAAIVVDWACYGTCTGMTTAFLSGAAGGFVGSGGNLQTGVESGLEAMAFNFAGDHIGWGTTAGDLFAKSTVEGLVGGAFSEAGGGRFSDGFLGAFSSSELSPVIGGIGGTTNSVGYYSAAAISMRVVVSAVVGGTVSSMTGGNFGDGAVAAAMQRLYNDEQAKKYVNPSKSDVLNRAAADATANGVPARAVDAMIKTESDFRQFMNGQPYTSSTGAVGLTQILKSTAALYGGDYEKAAMDWQYNLDLGVKIYAWGYNHPFNVDINNLETRAARAYDMYHGNPKIPYPSYIHELTLTKGLLGNWWERQYLSNY